MTTDATTTETPADAAPRRKPRPKRTDESRALDAIAARLDALPTGTARALLDLLHARYQAPVEA
jgi:hypothetical protein